MQVVPKVNCFKQNGGVFMLSKSTAFENTQGAEKLLQKGLKFGDGIANKIVFVADAALKPEEYALKISENEVEINAAEKAGLLRALSTLKQLAEENFDDGVAELETCVIKDSPRFSYRGYMLDVSRHFFGVKTLKKILDAMWLLKLNVLHLHLCDNQGFRLESERFPKLHEIGSVRNATRGDGKPVSGFYTKVDVKEIVEYAAERGIEVIPEIDMPGHTIAILAAYPELSCSGAKTEVAQRFGISREILCAGKEKVYEFMFGLLDEAAELFPSKYIHIGGDEAPKFQWENCPDCIEAVKKSGLRDFEDLQGYFMNRITEHLKTLGKTAIVWNESLNSGILDETAVCQYWQDGKVPERVFAAADRGRKIIISKFSPYYLDYPYGMFSLKKTYLFEPLMDGFSSAGAQNIIGVESPLWTEYVEDEKKLFYQTFPRLVAVAESGWYGGEKDFDGFLNRLPAFFDMLKGLGIESASVKESMPNPFKGAFKVAEFAVNAFDKEMIKSAINAKKVKETRRA